MRSSFGKNLKVDIWGGSHEPSIGVDIYGLCEGSVIDMRELEAFLRRRAPGNSPFATKRKEADIPLPAAGLRQINEDLPSGLSNDETRRLFEVCGSCVSFEIRNTDTRSQDYKGLRDIPRPGHADFTAALRYGSELNMAGGGPFSARMTAPLCIAGGIALQLLQKQGIHIGAHIYSAAGIYDMPFDPVNVSPKSLEACIGSEPNEASEGLPSSEPALFQKLKASDFPVIDEACGDAMKLAITKARDNLDSVGGIVECCVFGLPGGIGGAMYDGLESVLAPIFFGIPAVKGVEFGAGFHAAHMRGSENNDPFYYDGSSVKTRTNNHGGILGGITSGMPVIARLAFKPTPSIGIKQDSVDLKAKTNAELTVSGRHDPCVVVRAVPIVEAAMALGILDCMMEVNND